MARSKKTSNGKSPRQKPQVCVFCAESPAVTKDHVPPKGIFERPLPNDLITVPACKECNAGSSADDEEFRAMLGVRVGGWSPKGKAFWDKAALKTLRHNERLRREILSSAKTTEVVTAGGLYLGEHLLVPWQTESHDNTIAKTTRGLYFHHFGEILTPNVSVQSYWLRDVADDLTAVLGQLAKSSIGGNAFVYAFGRPDEHPEVSIWFYQFYEQHLAAAFTGEEILEEVEGIQPDG